MSPQKRRPQARKGRTAAAARKGGRRSDRTLGIAAIVILVLGITLVLVLRPTTDASGLQFGDHWHSALGVYVCDHWDGGAAWPTPVGSGGGPVRIGTQIYAGLHSHTDGLIHMEPQTSDEVGKNATIGTYFKFNGFEVSATHVKFITEDKSNGDKCGSAPGRLHWSVNGKVHTGNPASYELHDSDVIVIAFLADTKKITSLGQPPSVANLPNAEGATNPPITTTPPPAGSSTTGAPTASTTTTSVSATPTS